MAERVADTTTSLPRVELGTKATSTGADGSLTVTSWVSKPMEEMISTMGGFAAVVSLKWPCSSVYVPAKVPFTAILTAGTLIFVCVCLTVPVMVYD